jgi:hypothetical protein
MLCFILIGRWCILTGHLVASRSSVRLWPVKKLSIVLYDLDVNRRKNLKFPQIVLLLQTEHKIMLGLHRLCLSSLHVLSSELFEVLLTAVLQILLHFSVELHLLLKQFEVILFEVLVKSELKPIRFLSQLLQGLLLESSLSQFILSHVLSMLFDHELVSLDVLDHFLKPFVDFAQLSHDLLLVRVDHLNETELLSVNVLINLFDHILYVVCNFALMIRND